MHSLVLVAIAMITGYLSIREHIKWKKGIERKRALRRESEEEFERQQMKMAA